MTRFVLDASFTMAWVIEIERTPETLSHFEALTLGEVTATAPAIWPDEICNVLLSVQRSRKITAAQATEWIDVLKDLPVEIASPSLDESFGRSAAWPKLAACPPTTPAPFTSPLREEIALATRDKQLIAAAQKLGVKLVI